VNASTPPLEPASSDIVFWSVLPEEFARPAQALSKFAPPEPSVTCSGSPPPVPWASLPHSITAFHSAIGAPV
jgi:hypothetical protein